jgi:hypothetical protein
MRLLSFCLQSRLSCVFLAVATAAAVFLVFVPESTTESPVQAVNMHKDGEVRVLLVSSALKNEEILAAAAKESTIVIRYDAETSTLESLLDKVRTALGSRLADSICFATHDMGEAAFYLAGSNTVNLGTVLRDERQRAFWRELGSLISPGGHIDLLACNLAGREKGSLLIAALEEASGVNVAASTNNTGNPASGGDWVLETDGINAGSLYFSTENLSRFSGLLYSEIKKLNSYDAAESDYFGWCVAISGSNAIVGAYGNDDNGSLSGCAYIFTRDSGSYNWGVVKKIKASDAAAGDYYGYAVDIYGSYAVVGAYRNSDAGTSSGSAYVYYKDHMGTNNWGQVKKLTAPDAAAGDYFGFSVAITSDYVIVGAYGDDYPGSLAGSAYIFYRNQGGTDNWGFQRKIRASDGATSDYFGYSVGIYYSYAIVGAFGDDDGGASSGSAYIFYRNQGGTNNWGQLKKLVASDDTESDYFGFAVDIYGSYALVGAYGDDDNGSTSGSAYIFYQKAGGYNNWGQQAKLKPSDGAANDYFGYSVDIYGNYALVGAYGDDDNGATSGSAYLFNRDQGGPNNWGQMTKLKPSDGAAYDYFASFNSVAIYGYYMLIGAYGDDDYGSLSGSAYIFHFYPKITNLIVTDITQTSAVLGATVEEQGLSSVTERGVVWGTSLHPTTTTNDGKATATGTTGSFTVDATGLSTSTVYYFRGYAKNSYGTAYTTEGTFTTGLETVPSITNPTATQIKANKAVLGATVTSDGGSAIIQRGVVWSTSADPTTSSNDGMVTSPGTVGTFTVNATGLTSGATYHYRGYAINAVGTSYTADATFTTVVKKGRVKVFITPAGAKKGKAMWRLIALSPVPPGSGRHEVFPPNAWIKNGGKATVPAGNYLIEFLHAPGWVHPITAIEVIGGKKKVFKAVFKPFLVSGASDYDGDGHSDISLFRPSTNTWMVKDQFDQVFGVEGCWPVPGDYNADGEADLAWWNPATSTWKVDGGFTLTPFGEEGDIPVPADYNGDGYTDAALYRPSTGTWTINYTTPAPGDAVAPRRKTMITTIFGGQPDELPVPGDYDGDGSAGLAVFNTVTGNWSLEEGALTVAYGAAGDIPVQADYDGDGTTDIAVVNMTLGEWRVRGKFTEIVATSASCVPVPGDYDGDGAADVVYYRPNDGGWYFSGGTVIYYGTFFDIPLVRGK